MLRQGLQQGVCRPTAHGREDLGCRRWRAMRWRLLRGQTCRRCRARLDRRFGRGFCSRVRCKRWRFRFGRCHRWARPAALALACGALRSSPAGARAASRSAHGSRGCWARRPRLGSPRLRGLVLRVRPVSTPALGHLRAQMKAWADVISCLRHCGAAQLASATPFNTMRFTPDMMRNTRSIVALKRTRSQSRYELTVRAPRRT